MINVRALLLAGLAIALSNHPSSAGWFELPKKGTLACSGDEACFNTPESCDSQDAFDRCYTNCLQGKTGDQAKDIAEKLFSCPHDLIVNSKFRPDIEKSPVYQELFTPMDEGSITMPLSGPVDGIEPQDMTTMPETSDIMPPHEIEESPDMPETFSESPENSPFLDQPMDDPMGMAYDQKEMPKQVVTQPSPLPISPMNQSSYRQQEDFQGENPMESSSPSSWQSAPTTEEMEENDPSMGNIFQNTMIGEMTNPNF